MSPTGAGFHARNRNDEDVQDEIDIEGDDQALYGEAQFTEGDVLPVDIEHENAHEEVEVNIEDDDEGGAQNAQQTLRDLVAAGKVRKQRADETRADEPTNPSRFNTSARQHGEKAALLSPPDRKIDRLVRGMFFSALP